MKPEELQLGDIVATTPSGMPIKVVAIHRKKVAYHACTDRFSWVRIGLLQPIPLTPEILEKNGFIGDKNVCKTKVRDDSKDELWQCEYAWYLKNLRIKNHTNSSIARLYNIMFVHELQHALKLCGINKEIEI